MKREDFDMDGSSDKEDPRDRNKVKKKNGSILLIVVFFILVFVCGFLVYFNIKDFNKNPSTQASSIDDNSSKTSSIETIDNNSDKIVSPSSDLSSTSISGANVSPVLNDNSPLALDISKVRSTKDREGAVKYIEHIVQTNEDLNSISKLYGLKVQTLISINEIKNVSGVRDGIVLTIPDRNGTYYVVKSGDMLSTIANTNCPNLGWKTLQEINGLTDTKLDIGDKIFIPDMSEINANPAISISINKFKRPSQGAIIAKYGQFIENNPYNDEITLNGVLIRVDSNVETSAKGVVVDISNNKGKKIVKLSHEGGYETIYGNLKSTPLSIGDEVAENSLIGTVSFEDKILYFEIIQSGIPLDPESFF